jgi:hypothetical protein
MKKFALSILLIAPIASTALGHDEDSSQLGNVHFRATCSVGTPALIDRAVSALHNFYFGEAARSFNSALEADANCAIAYWGLALGSLGNLLASPPSAQAEEKARALLDKGLAISSTAPRERAYLKALDALLGGRADYRARSLAYEAAMEALSDTYPDDSEAAVFYALSLNMTALHSDKTYQKQFKAASILDRVSAQQPDHPGVLHYLIHSLDYPPLAARALPAAKRYAEVAPAAPHALHMPSHTYSMLGEWAESIKSNQLALKATTESAAKGLTSLPALNGSTAHYNDFMIYAQLQLGQDRAAKRLIDDLAAYQSDHDSSQDAVHTQAGFAAAPARFILERKAWGEALDLQVGAKSWAYAIAITRFTRSMGASQAGQLDLAQEEIEELAKLKTSLKNSGQEYWEGQIEVLRLAAAAWLARSQGKWVQGPNLMREAADLEDASEKHIAMENRLYPMRELLADMLVEAQRPADALKEYEVSMAASPRRFNAFYGAARAAQKIGDKDKALEYFEKLLALAKSGDNERPAIREAKRYLAAKS